MELTSSLQFVVVAGACRWLVHAVSEALATWRIASNPNRRAKALEKALLLAINGALPVIAFLSAGFALGGTGRLWQILTGLAAAAIIAGLHNVGKAQRDKAAVEAVEAAIAAEETAMSLTHGGMGDVGRRLLDDLRRFPNIDVRDSEDEKGD